MPDSRQIRMPDDETDRPANPQPGDTLLAHDQPPRPTGHSPAAAYPGVEFSRRSRNWWAWLKGTPPECIHLEQNAAWVATLLPDTLYLRGKRSHRSESPRPEVSLCRDCLIQVIDPELAAYQGRLVAFEPDPQAFTQYFFVAVSDFEAAGLKSEVGQAITQRLGEQDQFCAVCAGPARWLWLSREHVASLDDVDHIRHASGEWFCLQHGSQKLCRAFENVSDANLFYINLPYGEAGAYVWI